MALALLACFPLVFSACGGGGGKSVEIVEMTTISGTAVKGPIKGALIQVFKLKGDGTKGELLGSGVTGSDASYSVQIPKTKAVAPLLVTVSGQSGATYKSETTNNEVPFTSAETFNAALDAFASGKKYTISPLTDAAYQQVQKFITDTPSATIDTRIISDANARIASLFNVSDILADPSDPINGSAYTTSLAIIDQMVVSSGATNTLQTMTLINQAFVDVGSQAYQRYRTALIAAATAVITKDPSVAPAVNAILATSANPPDLTDTTAPNAVTNLRAVAGAETATTSFVTLTWTASITTGKNPVAGYEVYRDGNKIATVASTGYFDMPLALSTAYKYFVVAFDTARNRSAASAEITAITPAAPNLNINVSGQVRPPL